MSTADPGNDASFVAEIALNCFKRSLEEANRTVANLKIIAEKEHQSLYKQLLSLSEWGLHDYDLEKPVTVSDDTGNVTPATDLPQTFRLDRAQLSPDEINVLNRVEEIKDKLFGYITDHRVPKTVKQAVADIWGMFNERWKYKADKSEYAFDPAHSVAVFESDAHKAAEIARQEYAEDPHGTRYWDLKFGDIP